MIMLYFYVIESWGYLYPTIELLSRARVSFTIIPIEPWFSELSELQKLYILRQLQNLRNLRNLYYLGILCITSNLALVLYLTQIL